MSGTDAYLAALRAGLRARRVPSRRILAEVDDHLRASAARNGEEAAIARFGPAEAVAERFARDGAARSGGTAARWSAAGVAALLVLVAALTPISGRYPWLNDSAAAPVLVLGLEISTVAVFASLGRVLLARRGHEASARLVARSALVSAAALGVAAAALCVAILRRLGELSSPADLALAAASGACLLLAVAAVVAAVRAVARFRPLAEEPGPAPGAEIRAAGVALLELADRWLPALTRTGRSAVRRVPWLGIWLDLAGHPWRFCAAFAGMVFAGLSLLGAAQGGDPSPVVGAFQALAVAAGFLVLGPVLGLRSRSRF